MRTVASTLDGKLIPVTKKIKVSPLKFCGEEIKNGHGMTVMDDNWVYVGTPQERYSINTKRAEYCQLQYLREVKIYDSFQGKASPQLERFINTVSDSLIFEKEDITYRVFLKKSKKGFEIDYIKPYWFTSTSGVNVRMKDFPKRYLKLPFISLVSWAKVGPYSLGYDLAVELSYFEFE